MPEISQFAVESIVNYFQRNTQFVYNPGLMTDHSSSEQILKIVQSLEGISYITGHSGHNGSKWIDSGTKYWSDFK